MTLISLRLVGNSALKRIGFLSGLDTIGNRNGYFHVTKRNYELKCSNPPVYKTRLALPMDYDNVLCFMSEAYFKHEPVFVNIGLSTVEPAFSLLKLMDIQLRHGMTIIAEDQEHCILGAVINVRSLPCSVKSWKEFAKTCGCGPVRDAVEFFIYVDEKPDLWKSYNVQSIFECSSLAVDPEYRKLGIARKLVEESWYLARDCGDRLFRIDCTSRYTAQIAEGFGWKRVSVIPYSEYMKECEPVFKHITEPHTEVRVYVDPLTYCKRYHLPYKKSKT